MDNKLLVIGIDGGTFDLLAPWMERGTVAKPAENS